MKARIGYTLVKRTWMERLFSSPFTSHKEVVDEAYREAFLNRKQLMPESQPWAFDVQPRNIGEPVKQVRNYTPLIELDWPPIDINALHPALKAKDV